jgi:hypothetical protein
LASSALPARLRPVSLFAARDFSFIYINLTRAWRRFDSEAIASYRRDASPIERIFWDRGHAAIDRRGQ